MTTHLPSARVRTFARFLPTLVVIAFAAPAAADPITITSATQATGRIITPEFDSSLGILTEANVNASVVGFNTTASASGNPNITHTYSLAAGPFTLSGNTAFYSSSFSHIHRVIGSTGNVNFTNKSLSLFDNSGNFALPNGYTDAAFDGHRHLTNAPSWQINTATSFTYLPFNELGSITIQQSGVGQFVLPEFDNSLGELLQANVSIGWSSQTQVNGGSSEPHSHTYSADFLGIPSAATPLSFEGLTSTVAQGGGHIHSVDGSSDGIFRGDQLDFFGTGGTNLVLPSTMITSTAAAHNHLIVGSQVQTATTTTFYFVPSATAAVPEPSSFALLGIGGLSFLGFRRRRRRAATNCV